MRARRLVGVGVVFILGLSLCACRDNATSVVTNEEAEVTTVTTEASKSSEMPISPREYQQTPEEKAASAEEFHHYLNLKRQIKGYKPYYDLFILDPNQLSRPYPFEAMEKIYQTLRKNYDYMLFAPRDIQYIGEYKGEDKFLYGMKIKDGKAVPIQKELVVKNETITNALGKVEKVTDLQSIWLGEDTAKAFEKDVAEGRSFQPTDFILDDLNKPVSVLLGDGYRPYYKIGDVLDLRFGSDMKFKVVGFYKKGTGAFFGPSNEENSLFTFDNAIMIPQVIPRFLATDSDKRFDKEFFAVELLSGAVAAKEKASELTPETMDKYLAEVDSITKANNLPELCYFADLPIDFHPVTVDKNS